MFLRLYCQFVVVLLASSVTYFAHASIEQPISDPLADWDNVTYCDHIADIHYAAKKLQKELLHHSNAFHRSTQYDALCTNQFYEVLGKYAGLALSAGGFLHHYERVRHAPQHSHYPACLKRLSSENYILTDLALVHIARAEAHLEEGVFNDFDSSWWGSSGSQSQKNKAKERLTFLLSGTVLYFPYVPEKDEILNFFKEIRSNFRNHHSCDLALKPEATPSAK